MKTLFPLQNGLGMVQHPVQEIPPARSIRYACLQCIADGDNLSPTAAACQSPVHASRDVMDVSDIRVSFLILLNGEIKNDCALCIRNIHKFSRHKVTQRVNNKFFLSPGFQGLENMRMRSQNDIRAIFEEKVHQLLLPLVGSIAIFVSKMQIQQNQIGLLF
ncbi:hypothetical protein D3C73_1092590 [compost metagenome]